MARGCLGRLCAVARAPAQPASGRCARAHRHGHVRARSRSKAAPCSRARRARGAYGAVRESADLVRGAASACGKSCRALYRTRLRDLGRRDPGASCERPRGVAGRRGRAHGRRRRRQPPLPRRRVERRAAHYVDAPLNIADVQRGLRNLQNDPLVERINAELEPGANLGESTLRVGVTERRPFELAVFAGNDRAASIGEDHASLGLSYRGLVGNGDVLSGRFGGTDGARDNALQYHVPLTPGGMTLDISVERARRRHHRGAVRCDRHREPYRDLQRHGEPAVRRHGRARAARVRGLRAHAQREHLLDAPFSFSAGEIDGKARGSTLGFGVEWTRAQRPARLGRTRDRQGRRRRARPHLARGGPDADFAALIGQLQYVRGIAWRDSRLLVRGLAAADGRPVARDVQAARRRPLQRPRLSGEPARARPRPRHLDRVSVSGAVDASGQRRGKLDLAVFADYGVSLGPERAADGLASRGPRERRRRLALGSASRACISSSISAPTSTTGQPRRIAAGSRHSLQPSFGRQF